MVKLVTLLQKCIGCDMKEVSGRPDPKHISTSFVDRQNWSVPTSIRRYTRLRNGFSRKVENHAAAVAINYFAYNFIQIHRYTPRVSGHGRRRNGSGVECRRFGSPLGSL